LLSVHIIANWYAELRRQSKYTKIFIPVKSEPVFALRWNCADFLCATKKFPRFVKECGEEWSDIAWKQIVDEEYGTIDAQDGEAETNDVDDLHE
jgi:hypothetical protein